MLLFLITCSCFPITSPTKNGMCFPLSAQLSLCPSISASRRKFMYNIIEMHKLIEITCYKLNHLHASVKKPRHYLLLFESQIRTAFPISGEEMAASISFKRSDSIADSMPEALRQSRYQMKRCFARFQLVFDLQGPDCMLWFRLYYNRHHCQDQLHEFYFSSLQRKLS